MGRDKSRAAKQQAIAAAESLQRQPRFEDQFLDDLEYWIGADPRMARRIIRLVRATVQDPFDGIGKPEHLKHLEDTWSRRITEEHRLTYRVTPVSVQFLQARFHYSK